MRKGENGRHGILIVLYIISCVHPINTQILKYRQLQAYTEKANPPKVVRFKMAIRIQKKSIHAIKK